MDGFKMVKLFLVLALAMTVASQPLETIGTSGGVTLTTQLLNWAQFGLEAIMVYAKQFFGCNTSGTKVLVATGDGSRRITEIIDVEDDASFNCIVSQFPIDVWMATGGLVGDTPLICGGNSYNYGGGYQDQNSCYSLKEDGDWKLESNLNTARKTAANGEVIMNNKLVMAGGSGNKKYLATIEVVAPNTRSRTLPIRLPVATYGSCIVPWDTNTFLIIGGYSGNSKQTYFIHMANNTYTNGPSLLTARWMHACHTMQVNGEDFIIVAGGEGAEKSTEYLQKANFASGWKKSVNLPVNLAKHEIVASQDNKVLYTIGNWYSPSDIYKFTCTNSITNCSWTKIETKLQYGRHATVAMTIPDTLAAKLCS